MPRVVGGLGPVLGQGVTTNASSSSQAGDASPLAPARLDGRYINFRGYLNSTAVAIAVLCGEQEPVITSGYAMWHSVKRPLRRAITVFDGYDCATMEVSVVFGVWDSDGWDTSHEAGLKVEEDIKSLEWMAGAHMSAGQSPYVYVNTYGARGGSTSLVPPEYQQTAGVTGDLHDSSLWPWVIDKGIAWGKAWREPRGHRVYQEAKVSLMAFEGFSAPQQRSDAGGYFTSTAGRDDPLLIAGAPSSHALYIDILAGRICSDPKNNPILGHKLKLNGKSVRTHIPHGYPVWVPAHQV